MAFSAGHLWSSEDGALLRICSREGRDGMDSLHGGWLTDLHFSPDDALLVSTGGYIKVGLRPRGYVVVGRSRLIGPQEAPPPEPPKCTGPLPAHVHIFVFR
ncbi:Apoptotic protease-activating factor 1 [Liparis tanakae]|uniref:Apoptotic protease-activating factor 1 n=1 Tax=Liparis tanakae TaxID=230148 RepID=A0A4Z2ETT9_9TELE|nr:Apoptotic protease-activating factor 1 [Liparis tanakae]